MLGVVDAPALMLRAEEAVETALEAVEVLALAVALALGAGVACFVGGEEVSSWLVSVCEKIVVRCDVQASVITDSY